MDKISLVLPTHNRLWALKITMPHYLTQSNIEEIIIVDDGSTDATESYISQLQKIDSRITYIKHKKRKGPPTARNTGINNASNEYILMADDDVIFNNDYSLSLLNVMKEKDVDIVGGQLLLLKNHETFNKCIKRYENIVSFPDEKIIKEPTFIGNFSIRKDEQVLFLHSCALFKRVIFDSYRYDENYRYPYYREETDVYLNAKARGFKIFFTKNANMFHLPRNLNTPGGVDHFYYDSLILMMISALRRLASMNLRYLINRIIFFDLDIDKNIIQFLNNNYFIDKYFNVLKKELNLNRNKSYYKYAFAKYLIDQKLNLLFKALTYLTHKL